MRRKTVCRKLKITGAYAHYDGEADTLYVHTGDREAVEIEEGVIIDLDKEDEIAGIIITGIRQRIKTQTISFLTNICLV